MYPIITQVLPDEVDSTCYSTVDVREEKLEPLYDIDINADIRQHSKWVVIRHMSDERAERAILRDGQDILFDLSSHSYGSKLGMFARRMSPIQITYLGYPTTSGVAAMDYAIVDEITDPPGAEEFYTEKLMRMSKTSLCHILNPSLEISQPPALSNGYVTFGCFSNLLKHTKRSYEAMAAVLNKVADARLLLTLANYENKDVMEHVKAKLIMSGMPMERVILEQSLEGRRYLEGYNRVDIVLDTIPFNGATTTCDALSMGVPVVTMMGHSQAGRRGASILINSGLGELVADGVGGYVEIAARLARDTERLKFYRANLRERKLGSSLADSRAFADEFTYHLRKAWIDYCRGKGMSESDYSTKTDEELKVALVNARRFLAFSKEVDPDVEREYRVLEQECEARGL